MYHSSFNEFAKDLLDCGMVIFDVDRNVVDDRVAGGMGNRFLKREAKRLHLYNVLYGMLNYGKVIEKAKESEAEGLRYFFEILGKTKRADRDSAYAFAYDFIKKHELEGAKDFVQFLNKQGVEAVFSTVGCDIAAEAARDYFGGAGSIGNPVTYYDENEANPIISGCRIIMKDGETKLEKTAEMLKEEYGVKIEDCIVVDNDILGVPLMKKARIALASPMADGDAKIACERWIPDYKTFTEDLEKALKEQGLI